MNVVSFNVRNDKDRETEIPRKYVIIPSNKIHFDFLQVLLPVLIYNCLINWEY